MDNQPPQPQEQQTQVQQGPQKEERIDELDVIGGLLFRGVKYFLTFYRKLFKSQQYS